MAGQINRNTTLGEEIYKLSCNNLFKNYVEIGTWNGEGSTKCFMDGIKNRKDATLWSLESNLNFWTNAKNYWSNIDIKFKNLKLIYGRIIDINEILTIEEFYKTGEFSKDHELGYWPDIEDYKNTENVIHLIPKYIDVLLLDGGEFTTYLEFKKLKDRTKVIILDDTNCLKTKKIRQELLNDINWKKFKDDLQDRNGYCIFLRRNNEN